MASVFLGNMTAAQQNFIYFEAQQSLKIWFVFGFFVFSLIYYFVIRPGQKETPFFSIGILRLYNAIVSGALIVTFPFQLFFLMPELDVLIPLMFYTIIYSINLLLLLVVGVVDIYLFGFGKMFEIAKIDLNDKRIKAGLKLMFPKRKY